VPPWLAAGKSFPSRGDRTAGLPGARRIASVRKKRCLRTALQRLRLTSTQISAIGGSPPGARPELNRVSNHGGRQGSAQFHSNSASHVAVSPGLPFRCRLMTLRWDPKRRRRPPETSRQHQVHGGRALPAYSRPAAGALSTVAMMVSTATPPPAAPARASPAPTTEGRWLSSGRPVNHQALMVRVTFA